MPKSNAPAAPAATKRKALKGASKPQKQPAQPKAQAAPKKPAQAAPSPARSTPRPGSGKLLNPEAIANQLLEPVKALAQQPGMRQRLAEEMSKATGLRYTRQMVERWLLAEKTVEPKLGNALLLIQVAHALAPQAVPALSWEAGR